MNINSITLENFQCYYGTNKFEFNEGLNLIIGDNAGGKSKLYDAFYWVLYDKVFDTKSSEFISTSIARANIVSDKAKFFCYEGQGVKTEVVIEFYKNENEYYSLTRTYEINKNTQNEWVSPKNSELVAAKNEYGTWKLVSSSEIDSLIARLLPPKVQPYLWFQGEQVNSLIDFTKKQSLSEAINVLSDIKKFDAYIEIAEKGLEKAEKEYSREQKKKSKNQNQYDGLTKKKEAKKRNLEKLQMEKQTYVEQLSIAEEKYNELYQRLDDAKEITTLKEKKHSEENNLKRSKQDLQERQQKFSGYLFSKSWLLRNSKDSFEKYSEKFDRYEKERLKRLAKEQSKKSAEEAVTKVLQTRLPINVPEKIYVERMLNEERCLVCDRPAPKESDAYQKILELLQAAKQKPKEPTKIGKSDFSTDFKKLYQSGVHLSRVIDGIDRDIQNELEEIHKLKKRIREENDNLSKIEEQLGTYLAGSSVDISDSENIVNAFKTHKDETEKLKLKLDRNEREISENKKTETQLEKELNKLIGNDFSPIIKEKYQVYKDFNDIASSTRDRVYKELIKQLEEEANKHYSDMTAENTSIKGRIILEKRPDGNYMPKNVDSKGNELTSINDSNIILIKLSVIMAIISAKGNFKEIYPLISDAPTSIFGENYTMGFYKAVSQVYNQSIIMTYDFYNNKEWRNELMKTIKRLGSIHIIEPNLPENERENRNELEINITKYH